MRLNYNFFIVELMYFSTYLIEPLNMFENEKKKKSYIYQCWNILLLHQFCESSLERSNCESLFVHKFYKKSHFLYQTIFWFHLFF